MIPSSSHSVMNRLLRYLLPSLAAAFLLGGCASASKDEFVGVDGDFVTGSPLPDRTEGVSFMSGNVNRSQFPAVYFDYDRSDVPGSELGKIETVAEALRGSGADVIIAGFTDERGTEEYNRVLGERRALAVRDALIQQGVSGSRIQTVSFGEEMPASSGGGESSMALDRRAEFGIVQ